MKAPNASLCCVAIDQWIFRGQGNFFAVFACKEHKVVVKILKPPEITNQLLHLQTRLVYRDRVILSLFPRLGDYDLDNFFIVPLPSDLLCKLNRNPEFAQVLSGVVTAEYGLVAVDLCWKVSHIITANCAKPRRHILAVEVKPKCGVLFGQTELSDYPELVCHTRFELNQYLLASNGQKTSNYKPLYLFSDDKFLQISAVNSLIEQQQKYLLIYLDGELIYGKGSGNLCSLCRHLESFAHNFNTDSLVNVILAGLNSQVLSINSALSQIYRWQQVGAVSARKARDAANECNSAEIDFSLKNLPSYIDFVSRLKQCISSNILDFNPEVFDNSTDLARLFLLGASGSDVSIFMSFSQFFPDDSFVEPAEREKLPIISLEDGLKLSFSCDVIDADFKGVKTIHKHYNENHRAVTLMRKMKQTKLY